METGDLYRITIENGGGSDYWRLISIDENGLTWTCLGIGRRDVTIKVSFNDIVTDSTGGHGLQVGSRVQYRAFNPAQV